MKIGDVVSVCIEGRKPEEAIIKRFSFQGLVLVNLVSGGWMMVDERDLKER
jgi:hypothetical protein